MITLSGFYCIDWNFPINNHKGASPYTIHIYFLYFESHYSILNLWSISTWLVRLSNNHFGFGKTDNWGYFFIRTGFLSISNQSEPNQTKQEVNENLFFSQFSNRNNHSKLPFQHFESNFTIWLHNIRVLIVCNCNLSWVNMWKQCVVFHFCYQMFLAKSTNLNRLILLLMFSRFILKILKNVGLKWRWFTIKNVYLK